MKIQKGSLKKNVTLLGATALLCLLSTTVSANNENPVPETINLNIQVNHAGIEGLPKDQKSVNSFTHDKHARKYLKGNSQYSANAFTDEFTCSACHPEAKTVTDLTNSVAQERILAALSGKGGPKEVKNYFHGICLNCHKNMQKAKIATGPTKCTDCHNRK